MVVSVRPILYSRTSNRVPNLTLRSSIVMWYRQFAEFAEQVVAALEAEGHWADFIDPCSGLPVRKYHVLLSSLAFLRRDYV